MNATHRITLAALLASCAAGCSSTPPDDHCTLPVTREAGMGVRVPGCAAWEFGPTPMQRDEFTRRMRDSREAKRQ